MAGDRFGAVTTQATLPPPGVSPAHRHQPDLPFTRRARLVTTILDESYALR